VAALIGLAVPGRVVPPRPSPPLAAGHLTIGRHTLAALRRGLPSVSVGSSPARVVSIDYPTPSLGGTRQAYVVLPPGYQGSRRRYPVVEILHGRPGSANDVIAGLDPVGTESLPGVPPYIAVVPDGHGPAVFDGDFADTTRQRLGAAVSDDLRAWVDRHYRTDGAWSVSGLSSGGYGAAYLGSRTPGQYRAVCALSGNFVPEGPAFAGQPFAVLRADAPLLHARVDGPRVLVVAGAADRGSVVEARRYDAALTRAGEMHQLDIVPGGHTWAVWSKAFPSCLRFMLRAPARGATPAPAVLATVGHRPVGWARSLAGH
jgi:predicted esterase